MAPIGASTCEVLTLTTVNYIGIMKALFYTTRNDNSVQRLVLSCEFNDVVALVVRCTITLGPCNIGKISTCQVFCRIMVYLWDTIRTNGDDL